MIGASMWIAESRLEESQVEVFGLRSGLLKF